jgi:hypothetical protein
MVFFGGANLAFAETTFRLNLHSVEASECGAGTSLPQACISAGAAKCEADKQQLIEVVLQFEPGSQSIQTVWFRCAQMNEETP